MGSMLHPMRTIAVVNQKGGSAKTTTAVNLAAALVEQGKRVLIIDMDAQGSATSWLGGEDGGGALLETLADGTQQRLYRLAVVQGFVSKGVFPFAHQIVRTASRPARPVRIP